MQANYLIAPSEDDNPAFRALVSAALGGAQVDYLDARVSTPSVAFLQGYQSVFTWVNFAYDDNVGFGDNLAAYVDAGGCVVIGAFATFTAGNFLSGQIMTPAYSPVTSPLGNNLFTPSAYAGDGTSPLWAGIGSYSAVYRDVVVLQGAGILDGTFADGEIAGAYRPDGRVVYVGGMETLTATSGDAPQLLANAFTLCETLPSMAVIPETSSVALNVGGLSAVGFLYVLRRRRARSV